MIDVCRRQYHLRCRTSGGQRHGHLEAIRARKIYIQQDPVGTLVGHGSERLLPVRGFVEQLETAPGEQFARSTPEMGAVVDDQNPTRHLWSLPTTWPASNRDNPTL